MKEFPKLIFSDPQEGSELHLEQRFLPLFSPSKEEAKQQRADVFCAFSYQPRYGWKGKNTAPVVKRPPRVKSFHQQKRVRVVSDHQHQKRGQKLLNGKSVALRISVFSRIHLCALGQNAQFIYTASEASCHNV